MGILYRNRGDFASDLDIWLRKKSPEQRQIVSRAVYNAMDEDRVGADGMKYQVIADDQIAISDFCEVFLARDSAERRVFFEAGEISAQLVEKCGSGGPIIRGDQRDHFGEVVLSDVEEPDDAFLRGLMQLLSHIGHDLPSVRPLSPEAIWFWAIASLLKRSSLS
jgi:hypothetical protein